MTGSAPATEAPAVDASAVDTPPLDAPALDHAGRRALAVVRRVAGLTGAIVVLAALTAIWAARATLTHWVYVSELGADGAPTARVFAVALLAVAAGGVCVAFAAGAVRAGNRALGAWPVAATIAASAICFFVASQVTCTNSCPVPFVNPRSEPQDLVHIVFAVLGFALGCYAMLQCAFVRGNVVVLRMSMVACVAVATITIVGGLLAIVHVAVELGAAAEYAGMTIAIGWLATLGIMLGLATPSGTPSSAAQTRSE
jgi:hypothetical protein